MVSEKILDKKLQKKLRIEDAAQRLLLENGIENTSVDEIVQVAGIAKGTFYLYFADKEELVRCCVFRMCAALLYDAYLQSARAGNRPVADRVLAMVEYIIDYYTENVGMLKLIYHDLSRGVLKDDIMEFMSPDFAGMFQELFSYDTEKEYRRTIHQVFISIELTSSLSYLAIVEKKPDTIEVMKPYILDSVRKILGKG